jgi:hypothetical protein
MVPFSEILALQDILDHMLVSGEVSLSSYDIVWADVLVRSGYTSHDYETAIDNRWRYLALSRIN